MHRLVAVAAERERDGAPEERTPPLAEADRADRERDEDRVERREAEEERAGAVVGDANRLSLLARCARGVDVVLADAALEGRVEAVAFEVVRGRVTGHVADVVGLEGRERHAVVQVRAVEERGAVGATGLLEEAAPAGVLLEEGLEVVVLAVDLPEPRRIHRVDGVSRRRIEPRRIGVGRLRLRIRLGVGHASAGTVFRGPRSTRRTLAAAIAVERYVAGCSRKVRSWSQCRRECSIACRSQRCVAS
ncbi:MAG: hypothetical protein MUE69_30700 [Myxococcota bacterium]|nr:hypothetical protein [Myxococcota bacterium]